MRRKRKKPLPRGKLRDNSKSISVRMTEEQFQRLERYRELTRLPVTTYSVSYTHLTLPTT